MSWPGRFAARLRGLFVRGRLENEMEDEIRFHLAMQAEDNLKTGMDPVEARYAALRSFGAAEPMKERYRDGRAFASVETLFQDARYAVRAMRQNPGFTAVAVLSLALGIGANTAIFSLIDALMLRSLPVRDPQQLVQVVVPQGSAPPFEQFTYPMVQTLAAHQEIFSGVFGISSTLFNLDDPEQEHIQGAWVTGGYYGTLGLTPIAGRLLTPDDDQRRARPVAVIADRYWTRKFGRAPGAVGQAIRIEGVDVTIVGVSPPGFTGVEVGTTADVTMAAGVEPQIIPKRGATIGPNYWSRLIFARPRDGLSLAEAKARLAVVWAQFAAANPDAFFKAALTSSPDLIPGGNGWTSLRRQFSRPLLVLMTLVGLVLLIACANIANLLLARASARQREIAVRLAIGAGRGRIVRQLLTESALLAACGAALGIGLAWAGSSSLVTLLSGAQTFPMHLDVAPRWHVLTFTTLVAVLTVMLFGIAPALRATDAPARFAGSRTKLASALVVVQVSLSLLLLVSAGLFVGTLRNLRQLDAGFRHEGVLLIPMFGPQHNYRELLERISALNGVASASIATITPLNGGAITYTATVAGHAPLNVDYALIGPKYFETMRTPVIEGREFTFHDDQSAPPVAIVNQAFVRHFFPEGNPLGRHFLIDFPEVSAEIVGVVRNARSHSLREPNGPAVYLPLFRGRAFGGTFEVYAKGSIAQVTSELRREMGPVDINPLTAQVARTLIQERLMATLAGCFGALALMLAAIGLYGLLAYAVARRTSEIGIRMALGADRANVLGMVIRDAAWLLGLGVVLGLPAAWGASRSVSSMLFGLTPTDPFTLFSAVALLVGFGLVAGLVPAIRASRVDPMVALRHE